MIFIFIILTLSPSVPFACPFRLASQLGVCLHFFLPLQAHSILICFCILHFPLFLSLLCHGMTWMGYITMQFLVSVQSPLISSFHFFFLVYKNYFSLSPSSFLSLCSHRFGFFLFFLFLFFFSSHKLSPPFFSSDNIGVSVNTIISWLYW